MKNEKKRSLTLFVMNIRSPSPKLPFLCDGRVIGMGAAMEVFTIFFRADGSSSSISSSRGDFFRS